MTDGAAGDGVHVVSGAGVPFERRPADTVTGTVWNKWYRSPDDEDDLLVAQVYFAPGARSRWHRHAHGHVLYVTDGHGVIKERGQPGQAIAVGDVVVLRDSVWHWHGAAPDTLLAHFAVTPEQPTEWGENVTDEEYRAAFEDVE